MTVLIVGGGFVGLYTALGLERRLGRTRSGIVLVSPENFMQYQPLLPEAASGDLEPRHVVVPLRQVLKRTSIVAGEVVGVDHGRRLATVRLADGEVSRMPYDHIVLGVGSRSRVLPIPGLLERAVGFKTVAEAIHLRNKVLSSLEVAAETKDPERRRAALTFVFVGGGYAGVEALAQLEDLSRSAMAYLPQLSPRDMRWVLVEAASGILPEIGEGLARYGAEHLRQRGIELLLNTQLESAEGGIVRLSDGQSFAADTLVWTAGVKPHPLAAQSGFPVDEAGRVLVDPFLRMRGVEGAWAAGDCAAVPELATGKVCPPTAQHALRQAERLAANLTATLNGRPVEPFSYENRGQLVCLGRYRGVARVFGARIKGFPAWWLHRTYHLLKMPTFNRKVRIVLDWTVALLFPADVTQLASLQSPREAFERAAEER